MFRNDRQIMIEFISRQLPEGEAMLVLSPGVGRSVSAFVSVQGDDLEIRSNCPEWVSVREIYEHLRWEAMPGWEQRAWLTTAIPLNPMVRLERVTTRLEEIAPRFEQTPVNVVSSSQKKATQYGPIQVNQAENEVTVFGKTFPVDDVLMAIITCLVEAEGNWTTRADMKAQSRILQDEERLDRIISRLTKTIKALAPLLDSSPRGYRLHLSDVVE